MDYSFFRGLGFVFFGALLLATGGALTTLGWSKINESAQIKNIIRGIVREWEINEFLRNEMTIAGPSLPAFFEHRLYTRFKSTALSNLLGSGLLKSRSMKNKDFLKHLANYEVAINEANYMLDYSDRSIMLDTDLDTIVTIRKEVYRSKGFESFIRTHRRFKEILEENYSWVKKMWKESPVLTQSHQLMY